MKVVILAHRGTDSGVFVNLPMYQYTIGFDWGNISRVGSVSLFSIQGLLNEVVASWKPFDEVAFRDVVDWDMQVLITIELLVPGEFPVHHCDDVGDVGIGQCFSSSEGDSTMTRRLAGADP